MKDNILFIKQGNVELLKKNINLIKNKLKMIGYKLGKYLGHGDYGIAYKSGNSVLKITTDLKEASVSAKLINKNLKYSAAIYKVFKFNSIKGVYFVDQEYLKELNDNEKNVIDAMGRPSTSDISDFIKIAKSYKTQGSLHNFLGDEEYNSQKQGIFNTFYPNVKDKILAFGMLLSDIYYEENTINIIEKFSKSKNADIVQKALTGLEEMHNHGIVFKDTHADNIGKVGKILKWRDIGAESWAAGKGRIETIEGHKKVQALLPINHWLHFWKHDSNYFATITRQKTYKTKDVLMVFTNFGDKFTVITFKRGKISVEDIKYFYNLYGQSGTVDKLINTKFVKKVYKNLSPKSFVSLVVNQENLNYVNWLEENIPILKPYLGVEEEDDKDKDVKPTGFEKIGNFKVIFEEDIESKFVNDVRKFILAASSILKRAKLKKILYGRVFVISELPRNWNALYVSKIDVIKLSKKGIFLNPNSIKTFLHELGHRVHFKFANDSTIRKEFMKAKKRDTDVKVGDTVDLILKDHIQKYTVSNIDSRSIFIKDSSGKRYRLPRRVINLKVTNRETLFPSPYSSKNYREWFAEIFSHAYYDNNTKLINLINSMVKV